MYKNKKGYILLLCFILVMSCSTKTVQKRDIAYVDGKESLEENPARGKASRGPWVIFQPEGLPAWHGQSGFHSSLWELSRFSGGRFQNGKRPNPERVGTADISLTDAMKADVRRFLDETRALGGTLIIRIAYTGTEEKGCEPSNFNLILEHIRDLSLIMADYNDIIIGLEAGIVGPWGEMHSSDYEKPEYIRPILQTYLDNLPESISVLVRAPRYICMMANQDILRTLSVLPFTDKNMRQLGMFNDGYLGTKEDYGTWGTEITRERACRMLNTFHTHPYGGEIAHVDRQWLDEHFEIFNPEGWNLIQEFYMTHLSYLRNINENGHTIADFLNNELVFDIPTYHFPEMPDLSEYQGESIGLFMLHHMGYRFVIRNLLAPNILCSGKEVTMELSFENTGFGMLTLPSQAELIFHNDGEKLIVPVKLPLDLKGGESRQLSLHFRVPEGLGNDTCHIYLRTWVPLKKDIRPIPSTRLIRFANKGMWDNTMQANSLGTFQVR